MVILYKIICWFYLELNEKIINTAEMSISVDTIFKVN